MKTVSQLKASGYLTSALSVVLLAIPAMKSASENDLLLACLVLGILTSVTGMGLRWRSHRLEQKEKARLEQKADAGLPGKAMPVR